MSNPEHAAPVSIEARAFPFKEPKGKQLAFASITINDAFGHKDHEQRKGAFRGDAEREG